MIDIFRKRLITPEVTKTLYENIRHFPKVPDYKKQKTVLKISDIFLKCRTAVTKSLYENIRYFPKVSNYKYQNGFTKLSGIVRKRQISGRRRALRK